MVAELSLYFQEVFVKNGGAPEPAMQMRFLVVVFWQEESPFILCESRGELP